MASLFSGLNTARSGLMASQTALDLTAQNISNANTPGYTRQMLDLTAAGPNTSGDQLLYSGAQAGNGVNYNGVTQSRDSFLDVRYRNANSENSDWQGQSDGLSSIEDIFNEFSNSSSDDISGLSGQMSDLLTSLQNYQNTPSDTTMPTTVKSAVDTIAFTVRNDYGNLTDFETQEKSDLAITLNGDSTGDASGGVDGQLKDIAALNTQIASYEVTGQKANDLRDQRNQLLDTLSGEIDINVQEQSNGMVTVELANDQSHMLISADNTVTGLQLNSSQNAVYWDNGDPNGGTPAASPATVQGGSVDAYLQVINGDGTGKGQYGSDGIAYLKQKLNDFATNFDNMLNGFASEYKTPPSGDTADTAPTALVTYDHTGDAAATLDLSDGWKQDDSLLAENYTGTSVGNYMGDLIDKLQKNGTVTLSSGNAFAGSIMDFADSFTGDIATTLSNVNGMADSTSTIVQNLNSQRQSISSVSLDEEGINIVKYQQAYDASARVITAIDEMLDTLITSTGAST